MNRKKRWKSEKKGGKENKKRIKEKRRRWRQKENNRGKKEVVGKEKTVKEGITQKKIDIGVLDRILHESKGIDTSREKTRNKEKRGGMKEGIEKK